MTAPSPLIIGFDSEYERDPANPKKNVLLSIQWCVLGPQGEASDIWHIYDGKRPRFEEWIAAAVKDAIAKKVVSQWPKEVWACAHFTAAEVSMFGRRQKTIKKLSLLRGTFTTMRAKSMSISVGGHKRKFMVRLVDTKLLSPAKNQSLAALGAVVKLPKIEIAKSDIEAMGRFRARDIVAFEAYAKNDARIVAHYLKKLLVFTQQHQLQAEGGCPITLGGLSVGGVEASLKRQRIAPSDFFGFDYKIVQKWIVSHDRFVKQALRRAHVPLSLRQPFYMAMQAYVGGRNECFIFGPRHAGPYWDYDLKGAYTAAMAAIRLPDWKNRRKLSENEELEADDLAVALIEFEFPTDVRFPVFACDGGARGLIFPRRGETHAWASEIVVARSLGAKIKILDGYKIPWLDQRYPLAIFAEEMTAIRNDAKARKEGFSDMLAKEIANSAYGKMGQGLKDKSVFNMQKGQNEKLGPSRITCPFFAGFITAMVRAVLAEILNALPREREVVNVITDGFLSNATEDEVRAACKGPVSALFQECRLRVSGDGSGITEVKGTANSVCASRTRQHFSIGVGGAVLDGEEDDGSDERNNIAAHVGIKFDDAKFEGLAPTEIKRRRSELLAELFADRVKGQALKETRLRNGRDLIDDPECDITVEAYEHRLQMEYDFKRQVDVVSTAALAGAEHLTFTTLPWETLEDFNQWRDGVEANPFVLKTPEDLEELKRAVALHKHTPSAGKKRARRRRGEGQLAMAIRLVEKHAAAHMDEPPKVVAGKLQSVGIDSSPTRISQYRKDQKRRTEAPVELQATPSAVDITLRYEQVLEAPFRDCFSPDDRAAIDRACSAVASKASLLAVDGVPVSGTVVVVSATNGSGVVELSAFYRRAGDPTPILVEDMRENLGTRIPAKSKIRIKSDGWPRMVAKP